MERAPRSSRNCLEEASLLIPNLSLSAGHDLEATASKHDSLSHIKHDSFKSGLCLLGFMPSLYLICIFIFPLKTVKLPRSGSPGYLAFYHWQLATCLRGSSCSGNVCWIHKWNPENRMNLAHRCLQNRQTIKVPWPRLFLRFGTFFCWAFSKGILLFKNNSIYAMAIWL